MTFIQHRINVDATFWHCIDVKTTLYERHVPARFSPVTVQTPSVAMAPAIGVQIIKPNMRSVMAKTMDQVF